MRLYYNLDQGTHLSQAPTLPKKAGDRGTIFLDNYVSKYKEKKNFKKGR